MTVTEIILFALLKYGPGFAREVRGMLQNDNPTDADWEALFVLAEKSYEDYTKPLLAGLSERPKPT